EGALGLIKKVSNLGGFADIRADAIHSIADGPQRLLGLAKFGVIAIVENHGRAFSGEALRDAQADALSGSRDDGHFALQSHEDSSVGQASSLTSALTCQAGKPDLRFPSARSARNVEWRTELPPQPGPRENPARLVFHPRSILEIDMLQ